jgi:hypothetical protein
VLKLLRLQGAPWERKIAMNSLCLGWERKKSSAPKLHLETYTRDDLHKVVYFEPQSALARDAHPWSSPFEFRGSFWRGIFRMKSYVGLGENPGILLMFIPSNTIVP